VSHSVKIRLATMMFLQYFVPGATLPILSHYLKNYLHFEPYQVGLIMAMPAVAAFVAPFASSHIADRFIRSERMLGLCHLLAGGVMLLLSQQTTFWGFLGVYFLYGLLFTPTFGLTNTVALHHVPDARRDFGGIRMWGTVGWVAVAWAFSLLWLRGGGAERLPHPLYVSAVSSAVFAAFAWTLPRSNVHEGQPTSVMYWKALKVFARPSLMWLCAFTLVASMMHQVYYFGMSPFLSGIGFANQHIMPTMSVGQISEIFVLGLLGLCLTRLSIKSAMIVGLLAQALRYALFAYGHPAALVVFGIGLHGICYAFYFTTAYLYVEQHSTPQTRAGAQQILTIFITGFGMLAGLLSAGWVAQLLADPQTGQVDFHRYWLLYAALSVALAAALAVFFKEEPAAEAATAQAHA